MFKVKEDENFKRKRISQETFAKLSLFVISTKGRNLNGLESLRFLVANAPRNDKIQRSQIVIKKGTPIPNMSTTFKTDSLSATFFGKTRRAVLALLYSHVEEPFYLRQIARTAGVGLGAVQRELKKLFEAGIIRRTVRGRQVYYQANPQCPVYAELKSLVVRR